MSKFAHLHVYTGYTNPEGICDLRELAEKTQALGMEALAITDKNVMFGVPDFIRVCERYNIKPIVGCEVTVGTAYEHYPLVLLCENMTGYKNLVSLVSGAWLESDGVTPVVTFNALKKHSEGLIALSGGPDGEINALFLSDNKEKAKAAVLRFRRIFGSDHFFIELQSHGLPEKSWLLSGLAELAKETGVQTVATNAVHYVEKKDADFQSVRECIALGLTEKEYYGTGLSTDEYYLKSEEEMLDLFYGYEDAVTNAGEIAERCTSFDLFRWYSVPPFQTPNGEPAAQYFREICRTGLEERLGWNILPEHRTRLEYELDVIEKTENAEAVDYFLMLQDAVQYAKSYGVTFGPGRGSAPGCLALYACGITERDPVRYGLSFERFMNPLRITVPDVDLDVAPQDRHVIIRYLKEKYGERRVVPVCHLNLGFSEGHALRDVSEALGIGKDVLYDQPVWYAPYYGCTAEKAVLNDDVFDTLLRPAQEKRLRRLSKLCAAFRRNGNLLRSVKRSIGKIAILTDETEDLIPLIKTENGDVLTQYEANGLSFCGALDLDVAPLKVLCTLDETGKLIRKKKEPDFLLDRIDRADEKTFTMICSGDTKGVFQLEHISDDLFEQAMPSSLEDLSALIALDRPGLEEFLQAYLEAKRHPETVTYRTPALEPILRNTCGVIVYQEQVMEILHTLAGYSMSRADLARRAIAKRMLEVLKLQREFFVYGSDGTDGLSACDGCLKLGIDEATANAVFDDIEKCCSYAFNKSHAISYALLAYQTAYLKCHYPEEWETAVKKNETAENDF